MNMSVELLALVVLAIAATLFVVIVSLGLVISKVRERRKGDQRKVLYERYSGFFAKVLLMPLPVPSATSRTSAILDKYESLISQVKVKVDSFPRSLRVAHRSAMRSVLIDIAGDLTGDSTDRLVYFFYSFGFVDELLRLLESRHWWIRAQAVRDMGLVRAHKSIGPLIKALRDENADVRIQAMRTLVGIGGLDALESILRTARNLSRWSQIELFTIIMGFGDEAVPYLIQGLQSSDNSVVSFCIEMLGEIGLVSAVEPLLALARTKSDVDVRTRVVGALGRLGDKRAESLLAEFAKNPYKPLRLKAIEALGNLGFPKMAPLMVELMSIGDIDERIAAARALQKAGPVGKDVLSALRAVEDGGVQQIVDEMLEDLELAGETGR